MMSEPVCLETLFVTIFLWASVWGGLDLIAQQLSDDKRRGAFYASLFMVSGVLIWLTPGLTTCRVL